MCLRPRRGGSTSSSVGVLFLVDGVPGGGCAGRRARSRRALPVVALEPIGRTTAGVDQLAKATGFDGAWWSPPTRTSPLRTKARRGRSLEAGLVSKLRADVDINSNTTRLPKSYFRHG